MMRHLNLIIVVAVLLVAVILSTIGAGSMHALKSRFISNQAPFVEAGSAIKKKFEATTRGIKTLDQLEEENSDLITQNKELLAENQLLRGKEEENQKLREALDYLKKDPKYKLLPARIVSRDASAWWNTVKINRGFEDGVDNDMTVITETGLVGKVTTVAKNESVVLLITDENCKVAVKIAGTQELGILSGKRVQSADKPELVINYLTKNAALEPGQEVFSAGVSGGIFPPEIKLGKIQSFHTRELDGQAIVTPAVDIPNVEDVFVVMGAK
ncbi:MAG: rod shape-determining protein MreC [Chthoniobacterales bacterium]